jgi:hypothetical protein
MFGPYMWVRLIGFPEPTRLLAALAKAQQEYF